ncbi:DUF3153 domain-containing protein [Saccharopolyspora taberi]|uniref:DUF3153 domain-containing protein n=1 Tax=Saccharopolyspora taberi TaxID=60895 RepID=A0ABN3VFN7_9PSEU
MRGGIPGAGPHRVRAALLLVIALSWVLLSGCVHARASLSIDNQDRVSGEVLVSTQTPDGQVPFRLQPPADLADRVTVTPYSAEGRVGSRLAFQGLSFEELDRLATELNPSDSRYRLHLTRTGSLVTLDGELDLTPLAGTDSSFVVELTAPGEITNTNGAETAGMVTWSPQPGEVSELSAIYQFSGDDQQVWVFWALLIGGITIGAAILVGVLAQQSHEKAHKPADDRVR